MGTTESFFITNISDTKTPVDLSSLVLKELKNFIYTGEPLEAAIITIPASFDTIQSNATKKAGELAGFDEVFLLQEPIAASLAFANKSDNKDDAEGQWLGDDLGGGALYVAFVKIRNGEMKVLDHQGDNFFGGLGFDNPIIENIVVPYLEKTGRFENLEHELKSAKGKYNRLYFQLLHKAEEAKVMLSGRDSTDIEFEIEDKNGEIMEVYMTVTRAQFEACIRDMIEKTIEMIRTIIERNNLQKEEVRHVLMVGGSTFIPLVRNLIKETLALEVNCNVDPTTAVAEGAAYYAGTKTRSPRKKAEQKTSSSPYNVTIRTAYQKTSQEAEEYFTALVEGNFKNLFYRITRADGGFDTGLKELKERITEYLPLVQGTFNFFTLKIFDDKNNLLDIPTDPIEIVQGKFNVLGQPLPNDICIEVDDYENNTTKLEVIFEKNAILPLKKTITKEITKTIPKGTDSAVVINVLEGTRSASPSTNSSIGVIEIKGSELKRDLVKGSDIEITLEMSESRDLRITTYLLMTDQEFTNLFNPSERHVSAMRLRDEVSNLVTRIKDEIRDAEKREEFEID